MLDALHKIFNKNPAEQITTVSDTVKIHSHHKMQRNRSVFKVFT